MSFKALCDPIERCEELFEVFATVKSPTDVSIEVHEPDGCSGVLLHDANIVIHSTIFNGRKRVRRACGPRLTDPMRMNIIHIMNNAENMILCDLLACFMKTLFAAPDGGNVLERNVRDDSQHAASAGSVRSAPRRTLDGPKRDDIPGNQGREAWGTSRCTVPPGACRGGQGRSERAERSASLARQVA